jgi:hypothetical protein
MLSPDVEIAIELVHRAEVDSWGWLTEDLMCPTPRIHEGNAERTEDLVAWLAPYVDAQPSMVQAAVANFARVLADFRLVLHYDLDVDKPYLRVPNWYRQEPRSVSSLEEWDIHVTLLHNVTIELTRAINLVIARAQQAGVLQRQALAVCDCGPAHARLRAVTYTAEQTEQAQPYPGLAGFPSIVADRTVGGLGLREGSVPRTADEFERWIACLVEHRGGCSEPPQSLAELPLALPTPPRSEDTESILPAGSSGPSDPRNVPAPLRAAAGIGGLVGVVIAVALAPPLLEVTSLTFIVAVGALARFVWRWPPALWACAVVTAAVCGAGAIEIVDSHPGSSPPRFASPPEAGHTAGRQTLSATGTLNLRGYVRLRGTEAWRTEIHGVPGDTIQWELYASDDNASKTFTNVIVNDVLPQYVTLIPRSLRFVSGNRGDEILASGPLFGGGYNAGSYIPNDRTLYIFEGVLDPDFPGCAIRLENDGGIKADGIARRAPHGSATLVDVEKTDCDASGS